MVSIKRYLLWRDGHLVPSARPGTYAGIKTQKIFGRLDCWAGKRGLAKNRVFFPSYAEAVAAGYRPCKFCKPVPDLTFSASATANGPAYCRRHSRR